MAYLLPRWFIHTAACRVTNIDDGYLASHDVPERRGLALNFRTGEFRLGWIKPGRNLFAGVCQAGVCTVAEGLAPKGI